MRMKKRMEEYERLLIEKHSIFFKWRDVKVEDRIQPIDEDYIVFEKVELSPDYDDPNIWNYRIPPLYKEHFQKKYEFPNGHRVSVVWGSKYDYISMYSELYLLTNYPDHDGGFIRSHNKKEELKMLKRFMKLKPKKKNNNDEK